MYSGMAMGEMMMAAVVASLRVKIRGMMMEYQAICTRMVASFMGGRG